MTAATSTRLPKSPIRLLVVEDSPSVREFLLYLFASDQEIRVIGTASNGEEALEATKTHRPDVITMDLHMPKMDGYEATRLIMQNFPTPIVIVTGSASAGTQKTLLSALEAGALAVIKRPAGIGLPDHAAHVRELIQTVKLMSEIKVVKRWARRDNMPEKQDKFPQQQALPTGKPSSPRRMVAIGSSTGGPLVLQQILSGLPRNYPLPLVIVQHIANGFTTGFAEWLGQASGFPCRVAKNGDAMRAGQAYIAPNGYQAEVDNQGHILLKKDDLQHGHCPSVSSLFRSVAAAYGADAIGVILTGMGKDGAAELGLMHDMGALTIAQDKESSVVHGMPGEAILLGAASYVLSPEKIAVALNRAAGLA